MISHPLTQGGESGPNKLQKTTRLVAINKAVFQSRRESSPSTPPSSAPKRKVCFISSTATIARAADSRSLKDGLLLVLRLLLLHVPRHINTTYCSTPHMVHSKLRPQKDMALRATDMKKREKPDNFDGWMCMKTPVQSSVCTYAQHPTPPAGWWNKKGPASVRLR